jgi:hypothetical protein
MKKDIVLPINIKASRLMTSAMTTLVMEVIIHYKNTINNTEKPPNENDTRFLMSYNM